MELRDSEGQRLILLESSEIEDLGEGLANHSGWAVEELLERYGELSQDELKEICATVGFEAAGGLSGLKRRSAFNEAANKLATDIAIVARLEGDENTYYSSDDYLRSRGLGGFVARMLLRTVKKPPKP